MKNHKENTDAQTLWQTMRRLMPDFRLKEARKMVAREAGRSQVKSE